MCLVCRLLQPQHVEQAIRSAIKIICCIQLAFYFHMLTMMHGQNHIKLHIMIAYECQRYAIYLDEDDNQQTLETESFV